MISSSDDMADMYSSSESIPMLAVVTGVGGAAGGVAAEARTLLLGRSSLLAEVIVASAAFLFLVMGGIVTATKKNGWRAEPRSYSNLKARLEKAEGVADG
jgi:hypothetical protein